MSNALQGVLTPQIVQRRLYVYTTEADKIKEWKGKRDGSGLVKVGETTRANVKQRIWEQFQTASTTTEPFELLLDELALTPDGRSFRDHDVHKVLKARGVHHHMGEWFEATIEDVRAAILEIETGEAHVAERVSVFPMRPEQQEAVDMTSAYFTEHAKAEQDDYAPHFLWNAKMRFGKTFATYQLAKKMGWKKILVLTYKPAVKSAWKNDLLSHVDFAGWQFKDSDVHWDSIDESKPLVWFASFQDMLGTDEDGNPKLHNEEAHMADWDCVVLDEYHFGAWRNGAKGLYDPSDRENPIEDMEDFDEAEALNVSATSSLSVNNFLYLSGTPFRALSEGQFSESSIFNWTYTDEQREKRAWVDEDGPNSYASLPSMSMFTYALGDVAGSIAEEGEFDGFDLSTFFRAERLIDEDGDYYHAFVDPESVQKWLDFIRGRNTKIQKLELIEGKRIPLPFSNPELLEALRHTVWYLPDVASCAAMSNMLENDPFFKDYEVIVAAGGFAKSGALALGPVEDAITKRPDQTRTITLSCGKLMTGVTVEPWSGIFMLRTLNSPESYFQAAFRVQSPWTRKIYGEPNQREIVKHQCYVFDFDPNRALSQVADYNLKVSSYSETKTEDRVGEFLNFLPIFCFDGGNFDEVTPENVLDIAHSGVGATMLAKKWRSTMLVNVDNLTLRKLESDPALMESLEKLESFRNLTQDVEKIISSEKRLAKVKRKNKGKLNAEDKREQKENTDRRREIRDKLLNFTSRIPIFIYLTDVREETILDVIRGLDTRLFEKVTNLTIEDFNKMQSIGLFDPQKMNSAIYEFRKLEESTINYAGGRTKQEMIRGLWDTEVDMNDEDDILNKVG